MCYVPEDCIGKEHSPSERDAGGSSRADRLIKARKSLAGGCGTCAYMAAQTVDADGARMVDCDLNPMQLYAPYADACIHWERRHGLR